ncbi:hypothetical protein LEMLEM_LOCUS1018, partial [Lemmus lemmus]
MRTFWCTVGFPWRQKKRKRKTLPGQENCVLWCIKSRVHPSQRRSNQQRK